MRNTKWNATVKSKQIRLKNYNFKFGRKVVYREKKTRNKYTNMLMLFIYGYGETMADFVSFRTSFRKCSTWSILTFFLG